VTKITPRLIQEVDIAQEVRESLIFLLVRASLQLNGDTGGS
jgi:hypothetical protein